MDWLVLLGSRCLGAFCLLFSFPALGDQEPYAHLGQEELYRAINWIRDVSNPNHTLPPSNWTRESRVGDTLFIDGEIQEIQWSMLQSGEYQGVRRVVLNSYGGLVKGAIEFARVIREQGLDTVVPAGGVCMSACTLLFQAGVNRYAHHSALFLYHAPRSGAMGVAALEDRCRIQGPEFCLRREAELKEEAPRAAVRFFEQYLEFDMPSEFVPLMMSLPIDQTDLWRKSGNWLKTLDLIYTDQSQHPFLSDREAPYLLKSFDQMDQELAVVTHWFDLNPGWRVDRNAHGDVDSAFP